MKSQGRELEVHVYEGASHGFFNRRQYHHVGNYDAWADNLILQKAPDQATAGGPVTYQ